MSPLLVSTHPAHTLSSHDGKRIPGEETSSQGDIGHALALGVIPQELHFGVSLQGKFER